jgi:hypothetical protein
MNRFERGGFLRSSPAKGEESVQTFCRKAGCGQISVAGDLIKPNSYGAAVFCFCN